MRDSLDAARLPLQLGLTAEGGVLGGRLPEYRIYDSRRGRVAVAALERHFRARLYAALALPEGDSLDAVMRSRTARQWEQWARRQDLPIVRVARAEGRSTR